MLVLHGEHEIQKRFIILPGDNGKQTLLDGKAGRHKINGRWPVRESPAHAFSEWTTSQATHCTSPHHFKGAGVFGGVHPVLLQETATERSCNQKKDSVTHGHTQPNTD